MKNKNDILLKALSVNDLSQVDKRYADTIDFYRECSELVEKTYLALGRKKIYNITTQSTAHGRIDTRTISATHKI